jgi:hypothetical protein
MTINDYGINEHSLDPMPDQVPFTADPLPLITNDPDPLIIAIFAGGFLIAFIWNLFAYYKLFTLDHVKRELAIKRELRRQGQLDEED